ncbi:MAG: 4Fe-4S dicluster domain-containing protein [Deltaproteobacteria bacterium]|nr:4Fe-4S dicluster domain-containing protein [Deltaproteobacteria bacterium]
MGHLVGKDVYRELGRKIDGLTVRVPWSETLRTILTELYSAEDAALIVAMPYGLARLERLERVTGQPRPELERRLESLCHRGLVMDLCVDGVTYYLPSPMVIGIFEFTMMRTGGDVDHQKLARLFSDYLHEGGLWRENFGGGQQISIMRSLPHEGTVVPEEHVEVLDYEKATAIIENSDRFAMGLCACRHEQHHLGERKCAVPMDNCSTLGPVAVDFMVRNRLAHEVSRTEMLENVARSRELGLVINADNVKRNVTFFCHCCACCCHALKGISRLGYTSTVVTSSFIARSDRDRCKGCGVCPRKCPIEAIPRVPDPDPRFRKFGRPQVDESICLGCGVCALRCKSGAMKLHPRAQRVLHPETVFERTILQCLERGTLQNQLFDDPSSKTQAFMRGLLGGFLRLSPVKQALMSETLRSRFLAAMQQGATKQGKARLTQM